MTLRLRATYEAGKLESVERGTDAPLVLVFSRGFVGSNT